MTMQATSTHTPACVSAGPKCWLKRSFWATAPEAAALATSATADSAARPTERATAPTRPIQASARPATAPDGTNATATRSSGCDA